MSSLSIVRLSLLVIALAWQGICLVQAKVQSKEDWNRLRGQVEQLDSKQQAFVMQIETRLVRVETNLATISWAIQGIAAAVGLHLIQAIAGLVIGASRRQRAGSP